ncbi:MAG: cell division protein SepF [Clostridia bacterium]|nr:cell division protein SepF [Clostridia bacterium]
MGLFDRFAPRDEEELDLDQGNASSEKREAPTSDISGKAKKQFVLFRPNDASNDQLLTIADHLLNHESVILNLELIAKDARHFIDFLSGVAYAMQGNTKKVAANTFLITPGGIEVTGDIAATLDPEIKF